MFKHFKKYLFIYFFVCNDGFRGPGGKGKGREGLRVGGAEEGCKKLQKMRENNTGSMFGYRRIGEEDRDHLYSGP